ncbi:MAG: hypothetical protein GY781_01855 [Gammaproteobacteria bacterium]|nr:hypothetical protein [Gammaproteobacteria bacterium]
MNQHFLKSRIALPAFIIGGILLTLLIILIQPAMEHNPQQHPATPVSVIEVKQHSLRPSIVGFGSVKPDVDLEAKSEVSGRITYIHPELKKGSILAKGTLLLKVDDKDYRLALTQAEADLLASEAAVKEMDLTIENNKLELKLANEKLKVRQKELNRLTKLKKSGAVSQSKLDAEQQNFLQQKQEVQQQLNRQTTLPSDKEVMKAKVDIARAKLERSKRDLQRTELILSFNGRVSDVYTELDQYVGIGSKLYDISGLDKIVVNAQFPFDQFKQFSANFDPAKINFSDSSNLPSMGDLLSSLGLTATIELPGNSESFWQAKVERFSDAIDPKSRTIGITVSVSNSYQNLKPGVRPPLLEGMYIKVLVKGAPADYLALPRFALHKSQVFKVAEGSVLKRVDLENIHLQGNLALVKNGIHSGDHIITSDVFPAVDGMLLSTSQDDESHALLTNWVESAK